METGTWAGLAAFMSALAAVLRGENRTTALTKRVEDLEAENREAHGQLVPRETFDERSRRHEEAIQGVGREIGELRRQMENGFRDVKGLIRNGGSNG